jgi:tetratricopeptide (TPR) repeat protein
VVYGDLAIDAAKAGRSDAARTFTQYAIDSTGGAKDWQRDAVRVKVAQAMVWLGDDAAAGKLEQGVGEPEQGKVGAAIAARGGTAGFDEQMSAAEKLVATRNFDLVRNALATVTELAREAKGDEARWSRIVALAEDTAGKTARDIQLRAFLRLAEARARQGAPERAKELAARAIAIRDGARWTTESALPLAADIACTLVRIGDPDAARGEIDGALALFESDKAKVADIFRAGALRPVAEALVVLGDAPRARAVFAEAIEEGARNPNARPRAMDLAQTCASLARAGVEPDAAMWSRLREIRAGLAEPW